MVYVVIYVGMGITMLGIVHNLARVKLPVRYPDEEMLWSTKLLRTWSKLSPARQLLVGIVLVVLWPLVFMTMFALAITESVP
jgi:hypothetical protein